MGGGDGDVGEDGGGVGEDRGDDDGPPVALRRHQKQGGESPPSSSSSLTFSLDGRRVYPLVHGLHGMAGARAPPRLDLSLSVSAFWDSALAPFLLYPEIRNSDWIETFTQIFFQKLAFLRPKKGINLLMRAQEGGGAPT